MQVSFIRENRDTHHVLNCHNSNSSVKVSKTWDKEELTNLLSVIPEIVLSRSIEIRIDKGISICDVRQSESWQGEWKRN
jgi:hypothetical protein